MLNDQVMYIPGQYHKGILYNHPAGYDQLHVWPLQSDPQWGPDPDAHPYHDEYGRDNKLQTPHGYAEAQSSQSRIYIDTQGQVRGYPGLGVTGAPYKNHDPATVMRRVNEHIPGARWTDAPQPMPEEDDDWTVSHTLGVAPATVENVPGGPPTPQDWHSDDQPYLYNTLERKLYLGEKGAYHADMDKSHPAIKDYWDWAEGYANPYSWLRGRAGVHGVEHYDAYSLGNERDAEMVQPHFEVIENAIGKQQVDEDEFDWTTHIGATDTGEVHVALDVPERIRLQISRWVESLDLPRDALVSPMEYHITVAYAGEGVENVQAHELRNNFNLTGLKFTGVRLTSFGDALVIELENPYFAEWAIKLADYLGDRGVDVERYDGGPKPHITIAYDVEKSASLPPISFRCGGLSISTPRGASQDVLAPYMARHTVGAAPTITEYPGQQALYNQGWMNERQPFIYNNRDHSIHVGPIGQHHGWIEDKMGGPDLEYTPFNQKRHLHRGMMWHNPENVAEGLDIEGGVSWWNEPTPERAQAIDQTLRKAYPTSDWGTHTLPEPEEEDWSTDDDYLQLNSKTAGNSPPATPPPWTPGTWGKALFIDHPELGQQLSTWTTGTKSLVGGAPHHNQVAEGHHGIAWSDMIDMMRAKQCYLLQVQPDGKTYECAMGYSLPPSFEALGAQHGLYEPPPYQEPEEDDWTT